MLYFNFILIFLIPLTILVTGCGHNNDITPPTRTCPKLKILRPLPKKYKVQDYKLTFKTSGKYLLVDPASLSQASAVSQKKSRLIQKQKKYIEFYEREIMYYNEHFAKRKK